MQNPLDQSDLVLKLQDLNVPRQSLETLAKDAMLQTRLLQNNPREMTEQAALEIYEAIYA